MPDNDSSEPAVVRTLREYRELLISREDAQLQRLAQQWYGIEQRLQPEMQLLALTLDKERAKGSIITEQLIAKQESYQRLNAQVKEQVLAYSKGPAVADISAEQLEFAKLGLSSSQAAIKGSYPIGFGAQFNNLPVDAMEDMMGYLGDGTPLKRLLVEAYPDSIDGIVNGLLDGMARGISPEKTAYQMAKGMGLGLERITLIARTEQIRTWRTSTERQYQRSGVVLGSKRLAARTACMACLVADGEFIPLGKSVADHPRGRCTSVPIVRGAPELQWKTGKEWFEEQPEELQRAKLGPQAYEAWKQNKFDLSALRTDHHSTIWGDSLTTTSFKDLLKSQ